LATVDVDQAAGTYQQGFGLYAGREAKRRQNGGAANEHLERGVVHQGVFVGLR
jgi:hypothetical protein